MSVPLGVNTEPPSANVNPTGFGGVGCGFCCIPTCVPPRLFISSCNLFIFALAVSADVPNSPVPKPSSFMLSKALFMVSELILSFAMLSERSMSL